MANRADHSLSDSVRKYCEIFQIAQQKLLLTQQLVLRASTEPFGLERLDPRTRSESQSNSSPKGLTVDRFSRSLNKFLSNL